MAKEKSKVTVRRMTNDDLTRVNQIDRQLTGEQRAPTWPFSFETYWSVYGPGLNFVAEVDGQVVGFLAGGISVAERSLSILDLMRARVRSLRYPKAGWIDMVGILPEFQGKQVGRALIDAFHQECKSNGAPMRAIVKDQDSIFSGFLEKLGFKRWETTIYEKD